jgi:hypothetical protein
MSNWTTRAAAGGIVAALGGLTAFALTVQPAGSGAATTPDVTPAAVTQPATQTQVERRTVTVTRHIRDDRGRHGATTTQEAAPAAAAAPVRPVAVRVPTATVADDHGRRHGGHGADDGSGADSSGHGGDDSSGHGGGGDDD